MKTSKLVAWAAVLALLSLSGQATAAQLGDTAPPLDIGTWIKGDAVNMADGADTIYVVEFWATWCGPCRTSIPHLTELQEKYAGNNVVFIGISDESEADVRPFVDKMGEKMGYRVAVDNSRKTYSAYMEAYKQNGIPHAFVVDSAGNVAWHGHPMAQLDMVLGQIVDGSYDMEAMKRIAQAEAMLPEFAQLIMSEDKDDMAKADALGAKIIEYAAANPELLNRVAWALLTDTSIKHRNLDLAMNAAKAAYDATNGKDANTIDTYARAFYEKGDLAQALKYQEIAVAECTDEDLKAQLEGVLEKYRAEAAN